MGSTIDLIIAIYSYGLFAWVPRLKVFLFVILFKFPGIVEFSSTQDPWTNESPMTNIFGAVFILDQILSLFLKPNLRSRSF